MIFLASCQNVTPRKHQQQQQQRQQHQQSQPQFPQQRQQPLQKMPLPNQSLQMLPLPNQSLQKLPLPNQSLQKLPLPKQSLQKLPLPKQSLQKLPLPKQSLQKLHQPKQSLQKLQHPKQSLQQLQQPTIIVVGPESSGGVRSSTARTSQSASPSIGQNSTARSSFSSTASAFPRTIHLVATLGVCLCAIVVLTGTAVALLALISSYPGTQHQQSRPLYFSRLMSLFLGQHIATPAGGGGIPAAAADLARPRA